MFLNFLTFCYVLYYCRLLAVAEDELFIMSKTMKFKIFLILISYFSSQFE